MKKRYREPEEPETLDEYSVAPQEKKQHTAEDTVQAVQADQGASFQSVGFTNNFEVPVSTQPVDIYYHIRKFFDDPPVDDPPVDELPFDESPFDEAHVVEEPVVEAHVVEEPVVEAHVVEEPVDEGRWKIIHIDTRRYHGDMILIVWRCHTLTGEIRREDPRD
jgi:hypothetical protein